MREWLVAADDRTGAFEVAALFARVAGPVTVTVGEPPGGPGVVDIGSRGLPPADAAALAVGVDAVHSKWIAHKIDSTLRGNWAAELEARRVATGRRLVVLAGWPAMGRTCVDGVVHVHGKPIASALAGLSTALSVATPDGLRAWLSGDEQVAVCDVPDTEVMRALAGELAHVDVLVAGPAGPLGEVFAARFAAGAARAQRAPEIDCSMVVLCGSANPVSRAQVRRLAEAWPGIEVVAARQTEGPLHPGVAARLAHAARVRVAQRQPSAVVVIGGETAAAYLGDEPRVVGGMVAPGMPWSRPVGGGGPVVVTKAGGFGGPDALVDLLSGENA